MSKKAFKSQASSARAASGPFGGAFGSDPTVFGGVASSSLSYVYEPPYLSGLSDPNVSVAFKNVQKKDSTTKSKALEDLQNYIGSLEKDGVEEAVLEAWIKVYPRTSIDSSRRVRQLAHTLQGQIAISCGKRLAKHMPSSVPSWLAGLYDPDTAVNRAALESYKQTFATEEKSKTVWRAYHGAIAEYIRDIVVKETVDTLSDPRTTSPDDATAKYARVVGCAVIILSRLIEILPKIDLERLELNIDSLLNEESLWKLASHADPFARRSVYRLLVVCLEKRIHGLNPPILSAQILTTGLHIDQRGSVMDYVKAILQLSECVPTVWTTHYHATGKKSALSRFRHFLRKGSQGGSGVFWTYITKLLEIMPREIILAHPADAFPEQDESDASSLPVLEALREGVTHKDELRTSSIAAWNAYLSACELIMSTKKTSVSPQFVKDNLFPLVHRYIRPSSGLSQWTVAGIQQHDVCTRACMIAAHQSPEVFEQEWRLISSQVVEDFQCSLPEQSKDYVKSQDLIAAEAERWYRLQAALVNGAAFAPVGQTIKQVVTSEIVAAISLLKSRNGKPYGSAAVLLTALEMIPELILGDGQAKDAFIDFADHDIPRLMISPSAQRLIQLLNLMESLVDVGQICSNCLRSVEESSEYPAKQVALKALLSSPSLGKLGLLSVTTNKSIGRAIDYAVREDDDQSWALLVAAMNNPSAPNSFTDDVLTVLTSKLSVEDGGQASLHGLELIAKQNKASVRNFVAQPRGSDLMSKLLFISDAPITDVAQQAKRLISDIEGTLPIDADITQTTRPLVTVIQKEFETAGPESLSIDSLVGQADRLLRQTKQADLPSTMAELLPTSPQWTMALAPFISRPPNPSLAVSNPLGAAVVMIRTGSSNGSIVPANPLPHDGDGRSILLRMIQYVTRMAQTVDLLPQATEDLRHILFQSLALALQLAGDDLSVHGFVPLWNAHDPDAETESIESIFDAQKLLADWSTMGLMSPVVSHVQDHLLQSSKGSSASSYYHARAYLTINDQLAEVKGHPITQNNAEQIKAIRTSSDIFADMAILMSSDCKDVIRACNEFLSDLTTYRFDEGDTEQQTQGLRKLLLLNCLLQRPDDMVNDIPQQRLVFYVQHVVGELRTASFAPAVEIIRSLIVVLPAIKDIYGSFWGDTLDFAMSMRQYPLGDEHLLGRYTCLRLFATLKKPYMLEANDDLLDAWTERKEAILKDLVRLLEEVSDFPDEIHLPRRAFNELLSRLLAGSSQVVAGEEETILPVLASESTSLQRTAYELLHEQIPSKQEQGSLDKALTKDYEAKLPDELLSLILAPPTIKELSEASFERSIPHSLRCYLLSWILVFDHWKNASNVLQADYAKCLTEGTYLNDLFGLAFNVLISARSKPVDASKFDIGTYTLDTEPPEKDTHWLLIHLIFLGLKYLPIQAKTWWRDTTNRQTNIAVEAWTQKYISPLIIASELDSIREWAPTQLTGDQPLTVKVSSSAREVTASIPVDEQTMVLAIRLPPAYPLARAEVEGVHRVGVPEKKWTSWIRNAQGQLTIASEGGGNALVDCLLAWRKNVTAAMKGQSECAICYSVVGADRSLPSKVCKTCKNKFHGSCLFRWFSSSNSSSCPLCRNTFTYS